VKTLIDNLASEKGLLNAKAAGKFLGLPARAVKTLASADKLAMTGNYTDPREILRKKHVSILA